MERHDLGPISLLFGCVFFLFGGVFLVGGTAVPGSHASWLWPIPVIAQGLLIALMAARAVVKEKSSQATSGDQPSAR
jgi:hypothetical protein